MEKYIAKEFKLEEKRMMRKDLEARAIWDFLTCHSDSQEGGPRTLQVGPLARGLKA